jgi:uncharacterized protein (TIGR03435 family)
MRTFVARGVPITAFLQMFARQMQRVVVDRTSLTGRWDLDLKWTPDEPPRARNDSVTVDPNAPSVFTALEEQLGLRLQTINAVVDVWVIDRVDRPAED